MSRALDASRADQPLVYPSGRNRIINGDMRIDQRNAGTSLTPTVSGTFSVDRWSTIFTQASKFSIQQLSASPPVGFTHYIGVVSTSAYSVLSSDFFCLIHKMEGFNVSDMAFGTASAAQVVLSFWVKSSLTGTFGGCVQNGSGNRSYPFNYTINSANTWELKTIVLAGDSAGTWATDSANSIQILFSLGAGAALSGTAGVWTSAALAGPTGAVSVVGTNAATWQVSGVQFEFGSFATPFERRPYAQELALCQRYYEKSYPQGTATPTNSSAGYELAPMISGSVTNGVIYGVIPFKVPKRATPVVTTYSFANSTQNVGSNTGGVDLAAGSSSVVNAHERGFQAQNAAGATLSAAGIIFHWAASAEL